MEKKIRIITHSGTFHADELLAVAALEIYFNGKPYEIVRSRDPEVWKTADFIVDVGGVYDPATNRFDHHQKGMAGVRDNGIPYSSFGLVWKHYGEKISGSKEVADAIDRRLGYPVDMGDNGIEPYIPTHPGVHPYLLQYMVIAFRPTWKEGEMHDERFTELVGIMKRILEREIRMETDKQEGMKLVHEAYQQAKDRRIIVLDGQYPWHEVLPMYSEPLFVVKPKHQNSDWEVECVRNDVYTFTNRKDLPKAWAGLTDGELARLTGVKDAVFCHNMRYVAVTHTKDGALQLAKLAAAS